MFQTLRSFFLGTHDEAQIDSARSAIHAAAHSDIGKVRNENEDSVYLRVEAPDAFALVADGMGGSQGGKRASEVAARTISQMFASGKGWPSPAGLLRKAFETASNEIYQESLRDKLLEGMGTTCVALAVSDSRAWAAWVGDSRLYLIRDKRMFQLTEDHSMVREMVREGRLTSAEASEHDDRSIITRALGSKKFVEVSVWEEPFPVRPGDRFLLCSDGLYDVVPEDDILNIACNAGVEISCAALVDAANQRGGPDNVSAVLLEIGEG